jgi:heme-degrading monooxygenase HmoA
MIGVLVQFRNPTPRTVEEAAADWSTHGPRYETLPGFVRKHFLMTPDGDKVGGFYLWDSREKADAYYNAEWFARITAYAGAEPSVTYFEVPAVIDAAPVDGDIKVTI